MRLGRVASCLRVPRSNTGDGPPSPVLTTWQGGQGPPLHPPLCRKGQRTPCRFPRLPLRRPAIASRLFFVRMGVFMPPYDHIPPGPPPSGEPAIPAPEKQHSRGGSQKRKRDRRWPIALDEQEEATALERAADAELSKMAYGRFALLGCIGPRARRKPHLHKQLMSDAIAALNRSGNVLNQMQHTFNAGGAIAAGRACFEALAANRRAADAILEALGYKDRDDDYQGEPPQ